MTVPKPKQRTECAEAKPSGPVRDPYLHRQVFIVDCPWHGAFGRFDSLAEAEIVAERHREQRGFG